MKEFLGMGGYQRVPEGFLSWQHLLFIGILLGLMFVLAIYLGKRNRALTEKQKNRPLIWFVFGCSAKKNDGKPITNISNKMN